MPVDRNPFQTLYVTERLEQDDFPSLFSTTLVRHVHSLFEAGNVVVRGTQGTGKSMLLALLQSGIRQAFHRDAVHKYPVNSPDLCQFVGIGINLATDQALRGMRRWSPTTAHDARQEIHESFVDYVNTWVLRELLSTIQQYAGLSDTFWTALQLGESNDSNDAIRALAYNYDLQEWWTTDSNANSAIAALTKRIRAYQRFYDGYPMEFPKDVIPNRSASLGAPIVAAVKTLREYGLLSSKTRVLVTIDQFEELLDVERALPSLPYDVFRNAVDEAVHRRDPSLSYRIGTRPYAWKAKKSEAYRDYQPLDLDLMLRRGEKSKHWLFPRLAADVVRRRLNHFGGLGLDASSMSLPGLFGSSPTTEETLWACAPKAPWDRVVVKRIPNDWPEKVRLFLESLAKSQPIDAKLGVAWFLQKGVPRRLSGSESNAAPEISCDWRKHEWWCKERQQLALLQLTADHAQRIPYYGERSIILLAGSNILVFTAICQHIWDRWMRSDPNPMSDLPIKPSLQSDGIYSASQTWHEKISSESWVGDALQRFVDELGNMLREGLTSDLRMSYPGGNGISLATSDLASEPKVLEILEEGAGRGVLVQMDHTPKNRGRGPSKKWYLHPIFAPYFGLTAPVTKEPLYVSAVEIHTLLEKIGVTEPRTRSGTNRSPDSTQLRLPGFEDGGQQ